MPIATAAFVVSALIFAPLSSYVAGRRARSPLLWFALGVVIGPLAILLLVLAPPGRCPDCAARVRGWPATCPECGAPLSGAVGPRRAPVAGERPAAERPAAERPVVVRTVTSTTVDDASSVAPRPVLLTPSPPADPPMLVMPAAVRERARAERLAAPSSQAAAAQRRYRRQQDHVDPGARLLGSGIFLGGSAPSQTRVSRLEVGDRYGLARDGDELHILGPVNIDPERVIARVPLRGSQIELVADRLVVQGGPSARSTALAFTSLAVSRRLDIVAALAPPTDEVAG